MRLHAIFWFVSALYFQSSYAAIPDGDLYCFEVALSPPNYYDTVSKSCDGGKSHVVNTHVCLESVYCGYVSDDVKKAAPSVVTGKKLFSALSTKEKTAYLTQSPDFEAFPTLLTCPSITGSVTCPAPNDCVGDVMFKARPSDFAKDKADQIKADMAAGINDLLKVGQPIDAGTGQ